MRKTDLFTEEEIVLHEKGENEVHQLLVLKDQARGYLNLLKIDGMDTKRL